MLEKLSFSTNAFTNGEYTIDQAVRHVAEAGFKGVEILADKPLLWVHDRDIKRQIDSLLKTIQDAGVTVASVNAFTCAGYFGDRKAPPGQQFGPSFGDKEDEFRAYKVDYTKRCIDLALELGTRNISVGSGYAPKGVDPKLTWLRIREGLQKSCEYAEKKGAYVNLEYEPGLAVGNRMDAVRMRSEAGSPCLGFNLDLGHTYVCREDVPETVRAFAPYIRGAHIEDIKKEEQGKDHHFHLIPGLGDMPLKEILAAFKDIQYQHFITVELYTYADKPVYACQESYKHLGKLCRELE